MEWHGEEEIESKLTEPSAMKMFNMLATSFKGADWHASSRIDQPNSVNLSIGLMVREKRSFVYKPLSAFDKSAEIGRTFDEATNNMGRALLRASAQGCAIMHNGIEHTYNEEMGKFVPVPKKPGGF